MAMRFFLYSLEDWEFARKICPVSSQSGLDSNSSIFTDPCKNEALLPPYPQLTPPAAARANVVKTLQDGRLRAGTGGLHL
jgi:hypothetical protein